MKMNEVGAVVINTVCDNCPVNIKMLECLGAKVRGKHLNPRLSIENVLSNPVYVLMDPPHLMKLTRNTLGDYQTLIDVEGKKVKWELIKNLQKLQEQEKLHVANKLSKAHIDYSKNKMKVKFATQTLSRSVSNALLFCSKDLNLEEFSEAEATSEFLLCFDQLFDIMNSKNLNGKFSKAPMTIRNRQYWEEQFRKCETYIRGLSHENGQPVTEGRRSAAFLGWLINIEAFRMIFDELLGSNSIKFLLTYKLSQDPLEIFFSCIRASLGFNNNPTCSQFQAAFKKLLAGAANKTNSANCLWDSDMTVLMNSSNARTTSAALEKVFPPTAEETNSNWLEVLCNSEQNSDYKENVLVYIAGFIQRRLQVKESCETCIASLSNSSSICTSNLITRKDLGGLVKPTDSVVKVVMTANRVFEAAAATKNIAEEKFLFQKLLISALKSSKEDILLNSMNIPQRLSITTEQK